MRDSMAGSLTLGPIRESWGDSEFWLVISLIFDISWVFVHPYKVVSVSYLCPYLIFSYPLSLLLLHRPKYHISTPKTKE